MDVDDHEEQLLRSVAMQNARSILLMRQHAEEELRLATDALQKQTEWLQITLASIGDAVVATDSQGKVLFLNGVAENLTGWTQPESQGRPLMEVFRIINEQSRLPVENPAERALQEGRVIGLANHTILVARDGSEIPIDDSAAPIRDAAGRIYGVVLVFRDIRERKQAENALRRSERELADFFENSTVGFHWVGKDGIVLRVNRAELEMLGYAREEFLGRQIAEFHADQDVIADILRRLHAGEDVHNCDARLICKDGSIRQVLINSSVLWENGEFIHSRCFTRDVTDRKRVEEAQSRLASIVESSDDAIVSKTLEGRILTWNAGAERLFGYPNKEAVGSQITIIIPPERLDEERMIIDRISRGEKVEHYETVRVSKSGRRIEVSVTISPLFDAQGCVIGASKIARDITARKHAEQTPQFLAVASAALAELTDYESTLQKVASLSVPFFADWCAVDMLEPEGSVRRLAVAHADPKKVRFVQELVRKYPTLTSDPRGAGRVLRTGEPEWAALIPDELLADAAQNNERYRLIRELNLKSYICVPMKSRGKILGALTFVMAESGRIYDINDRRAAEDLAHRAVIAIENSRLLAVLQDSDRRKDEFLAMLAHELRNPLAPIRNAVQILHAKGPRVPELEWARDVIGRQVKQMTRLIDDLLDVSRITSGKIELRQERVDLASVVENAVEASRPLIDSRGHKLLLEIPPGRFSLVVDPTRISQVLMNLLNNAAKYMEPGGHIGLTAEPNGDEVLIRVIDTGIGIPRNMLTRIFEIFAQVDQSLERSQGGLGIGLTLVRRLVELHGGTVTANSNGPGQGSEFIVGLPLAKAEDAPPAQPGLPTPGHKAPSKLRILIVDDNQDSARSLAMLLGQMDHEVHTAFDGIEALKVASEFQPDVMLLDIGLPKLNGYEVARRIRAEHGNRTVLIALTGWGQENDFRRTGEAGFDHHLTKPVDLEVLQKLLASLSNSI